MTSFMFKIVLAIQVNQNAGIKSSQTGMTALCCSSSSSSTAVIQQLATHSTFHEGNTTYP